MGRISDMTALAALPATGAVVPVVYNGINYKFDLAAAMDPALDAQLTSIAGLSYASNALKAIRVNAGETAFELATITSAGWALIDDASAAAQATTLGLGTGDSPQFTAVNIGHATDTTLSRVSAGVIAVEGVTLLTTATGQPLDATLTAWAAYNTNGLLTQTAADTFTGRTLTAPAAGISVSNGDGVTGNPTLALANDLAALEALSGTNTLYYRSASDTWTAVTIGNNLSFSGGTLKVAHHGAAVKKAADQTTADYSAGLVIAWDAETYDTDAIHDNVTNNSRLTVPSGWTKVRCSFQVTMSLVTGGSDTFFSLLKNNSGAFTGFTGAVMDTASATTPRGHGHSCVMEVVAGDYFEVKLTCADTSVTIDASASWFAMELVE